jgi:anti-sigma regulatory factor (Ser/Thr protein kinase)
MPAKLHLNLAHDASAASTARRVAERCVAGALSPGRSADVALVVSELVTNAVLHGEGDIALTLQLDGDILRGEVIDKGGGFEHEVRARGPLEVGGRGLLIVGALTSQWGIHEGTTHVWFEMPVVGAAPALTEPRLGPDERPEDLITVALGD